MAPPVSGIGLLPHGCVSEVGTFSTRFFDVETIVWTPLKAESDGVRLFLLNDSLRAGIRAIDHTHQGARSYTLGILHNALAVR